MEKCVKTVPPKSSTILPLPKTILQCSKQNIFSGLKQVLQFFSYHGETNIFATLVFGTPIGIQWYKKYDLAIIAVGGRI